MSDFKNREVDEDLYASVCYFGTCSLAVPR